MHMIGSGRPRSLKVRALYVYVGCAKVTICTAYLQKSCEIMADFGQTAVKTPVCAESEMHKEDTSKLKLPYVSTLKILANNENGLSEFKL
jgi:hypothetical protein